jgi:hypothetical protein
MRSTSATPTCMHHGCVHTSIYNGEHEILSLDLARLCIAIAVYNTKVTVVNMLRVENISITTGRKESQVTTGSMPMIVKDAVSSPQTMLNHDLPVLLQDRFVKW